MDEPSRYLKGDWWKELDPIFARRLAYAAKMTGNFISSSSAYRSTAEQTRLYNLYMQGKLKSAARPGTSWHEFRLAIDTSSQPIRSMTNATLKAFGLCKPVAGEGWHIQPIETLGKTNRTAFAPVDLTALVKTKFGLSDATLEYMETHPYPVDLFSKLLNGEPLSESTIQFLRNYQFGADLLKKLGR